MPVARFAKALGHPARITIMDDVAFDRYLFWRGHSIYYSSGLFFLI